jgi:hypothetical protein
LVLEAKQTPVILFLLKLLRSTAYGVRKPPGCLGGTALDPSLSQSGIHGSFILKGVER